MCRHCDSIGPVCPWFTNSLWGECSPPPTGFTPQNQTLSTEKANSENADFRADFGALDRLPARGPQGAPRGKRCGDAGVSALRTCMRMHTVIEYDVGL